MTMNENERFILIYEFVNCIVKGRNESRYSSVVRKVGK